MAITTGAKEAYANGNGTMNSLPNGLKMLFKTIGVCTAAHAFMWNSKTRASDCGRKRVVRLMQAMDLCASRKRRKAHKTDSNHNEPFAPNLLERDFTADAPDKKWMTDMTFIETQEGWLYLAGVIDAYSRKIVGWAMGQQHDTELVERALQMALIQRQPAAGLVHHSDRGSEYASKSYQKMLQDHGIQVSMSKKGDCYDNAVIESFWGTLKEECLGRNTYHTRKEAKTAIFEYITVFYNRKRRHSSLGYLSPETYEKQGKVENKE